MIFDEFSVVMLIILFPLVIILIDVEVERWS